MAILCQHIFHFDSENVSDSYFYGRLNYRLSIVDYIFVFIY